MPSAFEQASALSPQGENVFLGEVPPGWDQGRGAFGGLVLGLLARAMALSERDPARGMRTLLGDICGPVLPGQVKLTVRTNRRGNNQSNLEVHLEQAGELLALGSAVFASPRKTAFPEFPFEPPPARPDWSSIEPPAIRPPQGPAFARHIEFRVITGVPFTGAPTPDVAGFVRLRGQERPLDPADLIALLDAHWPGTLAMAIGPRANATVSFAAQLFADPAALDWQAPLFYRSRIVNQFAGYFLELRELWEGDRCVAMNQQTMAAIK